MTEPANTLYYGDNLDVLRRYVKDKTVDLIYLDPPFNSNANVGMVRDLRGVVEREKAALGVLVSLLPPTGPMRKEAAGAGFYESPWDHKRYPKIQTLTVEELMAGKTVAIPPIRQTSVTFKKAPRVHAETEKQEGMF